MLPLLLLNIARADVAPAPSGDCDCSAAPFNAATVGLLSLGVLGVYRRRRDG